jgi:hypothetical protein
MISTSTAHINKVAEGAIAPAFAAKTRLDMPNPYSSKKKKQKGCRCEEAIPTVTDR